MKKSVKFAALLLSVSILMSSCIGSFSLTNKLKTWNEGVGDKFVNELLFVGMHIIPVYEITILADILVLNSIEFWTGNNALGSKAGETKIVKNVNGDDITVTAKEDGYNISNGEIALNLIFDEADNSWSVEYNNQINKLMTIDGNNAQLYLLNGETMDVTLDEAGVGMARLLLMSNYAMK
ncbi:MAG: DUF3332 domain-containing protein [Bacteroidaceae bacterium]|nr:DUF3332 domain-containing protein [Bacteroidaceae bacterium]MBQ6693669.1 DUF3332 domain-containing protein [Bacteroidaceae bacterium]MBR7167064.1 DUF3332 domain-containing protein [Bacteroidaceae bacterium]